jgi:2-polyprenyl-6-hydroxyphenyl methylase/3-demethylubiquinone-9 3-methyltransferase
MTSQLQPICAKQTRCKCCGSLAFPYGVVDFNKNCESYRRNALDISGVPIYYHRCPACRFIFTIALDHFTDDDFRQHVYNEQYLLIDPDYQQARPRNNAAFLFNLLADSKPKRILDYGGGNGVLAESLRDIGFAHVDTYDPFVARFSTKPADRYDCVVCFEVIEHSPDPARTLSDIASFLTADGLIMLSTLLQPDDIDQQGLNWWYVGPRNAHISLHSKSSLERLARSGGFRLGSFNESYHVLFRTIPEFAKHFLQPGAASPLNASA